MFCFFLAYLSLFLKIQVLVESWPKKTQNLCELLSVFSFWKISILILSIAGSGKIFLLEWDCSGFPSITPLFSTYASQIVLLLARLSIFVETLFFLNWEYKYETFKSNIYSSGGIMKYLCCYPVFYPLCFLYTWKKSVVLEVQGVWVHSKSSLWSGLCCSLWPDCN